MEYFVFVQRWEEK